jgi:hypothetical protein
VTISPIQLSSAPCGNASSSPCFSIYVGAGFSAANHVAPYLLNGTKYHVGAMSSGSTTVKAYCFDSTADSSVGSNQFQYISDTVTYSTYVAFSTLTAPLYQGGASGAYVNAVGPTALLSGVVPGAYTFAANSWPGIQGAAANVYTSHLDCFEQ